MKRMWSRVLSSLLLTVSVGCGGGGSSCPGDTPLECPNGRCCPRGYPYNCGNGYCYAYGCPAGSPSFNVCDLKMATVDNSSVGAHVPLISKKQAEMCVAETDQVDDGMSMESGN